MFRRMLTSACTPEPGCDSFHPVGATFLSRQECRSYDTRNGRPMANLGICYECSRRIPTSAQHCPFCGAAVSEQLLSRQRRERQAEEAHRQRRQASEHQAAAPTLEPGEECRSQAMGCMELLVCLLLPLVGVIWGAALIAGRDSPGNGRRMIILSALVLLIPIIVLLAALLAPVWFAAMESAAP